MIPARHLISPEAMRRYDDDGEPVYMRDERLLLALRWFGWVTFNDLLEALGVWDTDDLEYRRYYVDLLRLVRAGRVRRRGERIGRSDVLEYQIVSPDRVEQQACRRCARPPVEGRVVCAHHLEWQRERARKRRQRERAA